MKRGGIDSLRPPEVERLDRALTDFLQESSARWAALLDRTGQLLAAAGDTADLDRTTFATLAAAGFSASDQLAALLGEDEFTTLYHQGEQRSMYLADVGGRAILAAVFDGRTTLGLVRLKTKASLPRFAEVLDQAAEASSHASAGSDLGTGWLGEAEDEIDRLFGSA